jgi:hypothetical protein
MAGQFVVTRGGRDAFCTEEDLRRLASKGQLDAGDLVYHPTLGRWLYAREVEEVREEMVAAATLGRPQREQQQLPVNSDAVAGFVLGFLGYMPVVGVIFCLLGIVFSVRALKRAPLIQWHGHGLAIAGLVLSTVFLVPAAACTAVILANINGVP